MITTEYTVVGMTCEHCVRAISEEVERVPGVRSVHVDLSTSILAVTSERPVTAAAIRAAVVEAGYELATP